MRNVALVSIVAASLLAASCGGGLATSASAEHALAIADSLPSPWDIKTPARGELKVAKVRLWVDATARSENGWKDHFTDELDYANQALAPLIGLRLDVTEVKEWNRVGDFGSAVAELGRQDAGAMNKPGETTGDVDWVIGLIGPDNAGGANTQPHSAVSELQNSQTMGRLLVVRAYDAPIEAAALRARTGISGINESGTAATDLSEYFGAHRRHKQAVLILHALARTLSAIDETDPTWIQHQEYSTTQNTFSERNRELLRIALTGKFAHDPAGTTANSLLTAIEKNQWGGWVAGDREDVVSTLHNIIVQSKKGEAAADVPASTFEQFDRARKAAAAQNWPVAHNELDPLLAAYPADGTLHMLACAIDIGEHGPTSPVSAICARSIELAPGDPKPYVLIANAWVLKHDVKQVRASLQAAAALIPSLKVGGPVAWLAVATVYQSIGVLTWTEEALSHAGVPLAATAKDQVPGANIAAWAQQLRVRYGLAASMKVAPGEEGELLDASKQALDQVYANKFGEASRTISSGLKRWPNAPGLLAARCDLALRQNQNDAARRDCEAAIHRDDHDSWAHYLLGIIDLARPGAEKQGIAHLRHAIADDPDLGQAWRSLGKALERSKDQTGLTKVRDDYQARFGHAL